ncbi:MAG: peptidylprolyl isomerase [Roseiflexaceae bacterium]
MAKQKNASSGANDAPQPVSNVPAYLAAIVVLLVLILIGWSLGGGESTTTTAGSDMPVTVVSAPADEIQPEMPADGPYTEAPPMNIDASKTYTATITTPRGDIVIGLRPDLAPQTVNSFVFLAREGYYDGLTWHRVIADFMAQGGDPTGTGAGGPGYTVPAEFSAVSFDRPGILAMARPGNDINGNGSQFFITTAPATYLDGQYTIFGEVISGQEIVDGIPLRDPMSATEPGEQMLSITITES